MIRYKCKEMGLNCSFMVKGETVEEVTKLALEHVREKHAKDFNIIQSPEQIVQMEQALVYSMREVAG